MGSMHGGAAMTIMDFATHSAMVLKHKSLDSNVSTELKMSFFEPAIMGSEILILAEVLKVSRRMGFAMCSFYREEDFGLVFKGH